MSLPRFLHAPLPAYGAIDLDGAEARHANNVLRLPVGATVILFDGQGGEALANVKNISKRSVQVEVIERTDTNRELKNPLQLLVALPKGERQKTLIDGLVQFGTTQLTPLNCQRGVAQPTASVLERLRRSVAESSKQCGRNQLLQVSMPQSIEEVVTSPTDLSRCLSLVAHPYGPAPSLHDLVTAAHVHGQGRVAIGPEGGFTEDEVEQLLAAGWSQVALGPRLLRVEYAALQVAAWWAALKS